MGDARRPPLRLIVLSVYSPRPSYLRPLPLLLPDLLEPRLRDCTIRTSVANKRHSDVRKVPSPSPNPPMP